LDTPEAVSTSRITDPCSLWVIGTKVTCGGLHLANSRSSAVAYQLKVEKASRTFAARSG